MASKVSSGLAITGIIFIVIGLIMIAVGLILYFLNTSGNSSWYLWLLVFGGIIVGVIGAIMLTAALWPKSEVVAAPIMSCADLQANLPKTCMAPRMVEYVQAPMPPMQIQMPTYSVQTATVTPVPAPASPMVSQTSYVSHVSEDPRPIETYSTRPVQGQKPVFVRDPVTGEMRQTIADTETMITTKTTTDYPKQTIYGGGVVPGGMIPQQYTTSAPAVMQGGQQSMFLQQATPATVLPQTSLSQQQAAVAAAAASQHASVAQQAANQANIHASQAGVNPGSPSANAAAINANTSQQAANQAAMAAAAASQHANVAAQQPFAAPASAAAANQAANQAAGASAVAQQAAGAAAGHAAQAQASASQGMFNPQVVPGQPLSPAAGLTTAQIMGNQLSTIPQQQRQVAVPVLLSNPPTSPVIVTASGQTY